MKVVFISHNSKDKPFVRQLAKSLSKYGISCWVDESEIKFGESLIQKISKAIEEIEVVVAVISSNSVQSSWVRQELDWAMTKEISRSRVVVIPLVIDKCDIPFFLANKLYADFTNKERYNENIKELVDSINYHRGLAKHSKTGHTKIGETITIRYNPTNIPLILSVILMFTAICLILATLFYSKSGQGIQNLEQLKGHVYSFSFLLIGLQTLEVVRLLFLRYLIRIDPAFANDIGMIRITSLFFERYRNLVSKYWSRDLVKISVFFEVVTLIGIGLLIHYTIKIIKFL